MNTMIRRCSFPGFVLRSAGYLALLIASITLLRAQITIDLPDNVPLQPAMSGQTFDVFIQNDTGSARSDITGLKFQIQTTDSGPSGSGSIPAPSISYVNVVAGTMFQSVNDGSGSNHDGNRHDVGVSPQVFLQEVATISSPPTTATIPTGLSKVATVTIDTTGFTSGTYTMTLRTVNGDTLFTTTGADFGPPALTLLDGSITIVPEPNAGVVVACSLLIIGGVWRWRRRSARAVA